MTKLLNSAFEEISKLPEIESEKSGEKSFQIVKIYFQILQIQL